MINIERTETKTATVHLKCEIAGVTYRINITFEDGILVNSRLIMGTQETIDVNKTEQWELIHAAAEIVLKKKAT